MTKNKFYCKKCGNVVGEYQIKDDLVSLNLTSYCHNYCYMCGEKVDKEKFKRDLDFDINKCQSRKEEESKLQKLLDYMVNGGVQRK